MKSKKQVPFYFSDGKTFSEDFLLFEKIITDRGSRYSVSGGKVRSREDIQVFLKGLRSKKKYQKATHNSWAARITKDQSVWDVKNDDGEMGAGHVILRILQKENWVDIIVVVTRWFGGVKLQGDRFKHLQNATRYFLEQIEHKE